MKPGPANAWLPIIPIRGERQRRLFEPTHLHTESGDDILSSCLACPDEPCTRFSDAEVASKARVDAPYSPDPAVCPTNAIQTGEHGFPAVDDRSCIGCGLCVIRCPVGAIHLTPHGLAEISYPDARSYSPVEVTQEEFMSSRSRLSSLLSSEVHPFSDAHQVKTQLARAAEPLTGVDGQRVLRFMARNTFLLAGTPALLKNPGDNNAVCELLVDDGALFLVSEVEAGSDVLDALRRSLAGCAVLISRYGVSPDEVGGAVFLPHLPNERVDYYRVVGDIRERLCLATYTIPAAVLLLAIRTGGKGLTGFIQDACEIDDDNVSMASAVSRLFGALDDPEVLGLAPSK